MKSEISQFKNKILVPTLFAHSNEWHKYLPVEAPLKAQDKVREKKNRQLENDVLTMLQKRDDRNKQTLTISLKDPPMESPQQPIKKRIRVRPHQILNPQNCRIENMGDDSPRTPFDYLLEVEEVERNKLMDMKQKLSKRGIITRSIEEKKKRELEKEFLAYQHNIDRDFNITKVDIMKAEDEKAEKAKEFREFIERSRLAQEKDLKSRFKRDSKGFLFTKSVQALKRPKSISELQPLIRKIESFHKVAGQSLKKFEQAFKELEEIQLDFKMKPIEEDPKGTIDYLNEFRNQQIQANREMFPLTV